MTSPLGGAKWPQEREAQMIAMRRSQMLVAQWCGLFGLTFLVQAQMPSVSYDKGGAALGNVRLITPDQKEFQVELSRLAGASALRALGGLVPYCVIGRNDSGQPVIAVSVRYDITEVSGRRYHWDFRREGLTARMGRLLPGASYLITPSSKVEALLGRRPTGTAEIEAAATEAERDLRALKTVAISLDSAVLADGLLVGPDRSGSYRLFGEWLRAQDDLIRELDNASSKTDPDLERLLSSKREKPAMSFADRDLYGRRQEFLARVLLEVLNRGGRTAFAKELELLKSQNRISLRRE